jgi:hypothetical protein
MDRFLIASEATAAIGATVSVPEAVMVNPTVARHG